MLEVLGVSHSNELFADIPPRLRLRGGLDIPDGISEEEALRVLKDLASMNLKGVSFLGCGMYDRSIPSTVIELSGLPSFVSAYTPYQPEISQGLLQGIFEFQTMICELTGMDVSNASLYDGHTAAAEAAAIAFNSKRRSTSILVSSTVHPWTVEVLKTYFSDLGLEIRMLQRKGLQTDFSLLAEAFDEGTAGLIVQTPNVFGVLEDLSGIADSVHERGGLLIVSSDPMALALTRSQGEWGADIAVGDTQPFGIPTSFGGPTVGYIAAKESLLRKMPGRIVGETVDTEGRRAFVLTLQAREQHIKRERATSNICSNQALAALTTAIYLSLVGYAGIQEACELSVRKAHHLADRLQNDLGMQLASEAPYLFEFTLDVGTAEAADTFIKEMLDLGIYAGIHLGRFHQDLEGLVAVAVTERRTAEELAAYVSAAKEVLG